MGDRLGVPCVVNILAKSQFGFFYCIRLVFHFSETNYTFVNYQSVARICSFSVERKLNIEKEHILATD